MNGLFLLVKHKRWCIVWSSIETMVMQCFFLLFNLRTNKKIKFFFTFSQFLAQNSICTIILCLDSALFGIV